MFILTFGKYCFNLNTEVLCMIEYVLIIAIFNVMIGLAIVLNDIHESQKIKDFFGGTVIISKKELIQTIFLWLPFLLLHLYRLKKQRAIKNKIGH